MISQEDKLMAPVVASKLRKWTTKRPMVSEKFITKFNSGRKRYQLSGPKLRSICNYLRTEAQVPIVATSSGYSIQPSTKALLKQYNSLKSRAEHITNAANGVRKMINRMKRQKV
jgi:hypothetical protein